MESSRVDISPQLASRLKKLVDLTRPLDIFMVLEVRRASRKDQTLLDVITHEQLDAVFDLIIQSKIKDLPKERKDEVKRSGGRCLLPLAGRTYPPTSRIEDEQVMERLFGPGEPPSDAEAHAAFVTIFDDTLLRHILDLLDFYRIPDEVRGNLQVPYIMAEAFRPVMESVMRDRICPAIRSSRSIMLLETSHIWSKTGDWPLTELLYGDDDNNALFFTWDDRWSQLRPPVPKQQDKAKAAKDGGLLGRLTGKAAKPPPKPPSKAEQQKIKELKAFWKDLSDKAEQGNYLPPKVTHLPLFLSMLRFNLRKIERAWEELADLYQQEFDPKEHQQVGREGSFRDGLNKWHNRLPEHAGEFLVIKAFFALEKCDATFLKKYAVTHGVKEEERRRQIPFLMGFMDQLG